MSDREPLTYADAGVSLDAAEAVVERSATAVESTRTRQRAGRRRRVRRPVRPAASPTRCWSPGTDGVGTKLLLGKRGRARCRGLGVDLRGDVRQRRASRPAPAPLFFLDYIACGRLDPERIAALVEGVADGCRQAGCALLGGETAEHPDMMGADDFDLAGLLRRHRASGGS